MKENRRNQAKVIRDLQAQEEERGALKGEITSSSDKSKSTEQSFIVNYYRQTGEAEDHQKEEERSPKKETEGSRNSQNP